MNMKSLWLRLKYAWTILTDKDFYSKMKEYRNLNKYAKILAAFSKGELMFDNIDVDETFHFGRVYKCHLDYVSTNQEACFDLKRYCALSPKLTTEFLELVRK